MEINFSDDASKLNDSFAPEEGIFSGGSDLDSILITEFTDSTGFTSSPSAENIKANIPVKSLLANGFRLLHDDLSSLKVIGVVAGAGSVASNLLSGTAGGVVNGLADAIGDALGSFAGGIAEGIGNSLQDLDTVKNDPDIQAIKKEGLLAYNKAFYDPTLQTISGALSGMTNAVAKAVGELAGGLAEGIVNSVGDAKIVSEDDSNGGDILNETARSKSIYLTKKYGLIKYAEAFYSPALQGISGALSGMTNAVTKAVGELAGGLAEGILNSVADAKISTEDDSNEGDVLNADARAKSIYLTKKYGLIKYAEAFYDPDLQGASGALSGITNAVTKAAGEFAGGLAEGIFNSISDASLSLEDDSNGGDVLSAEDRSRSIRLTKKYGLIKYAEAFYDPTVQEASGVLSAIAKGIGQVGPEFFGGLIEGSLNALTDAKTLMTDPDIAAAKKKGMQVYIETLYGEDAMKQKAELALASSKWGDAASGFVDAVGNFVSSTVEGAVEIVASPVTGLIKVIKGSGEETTATDTSAPSTISVLPNTQYTVPLNSIERQIGDIKEYTDLTSQKIGSQTATLVLKLEELSEKLSSIIEVVGATANNSSGPTSFFRGVDIEA